MPYDNRPRGATSKPITPALSSNFRARPGVAPRLAGSAPSSPANGSHRVLRAQTVSPGREEQVASLNGNVTPRSGARNSRISVESPATPVGARITQPALIKRSPTQVGLGISSPQERPPISIGYVSAPAVPRRLSGGSSVSQVKDEAKFFHASDIKAASTPPNRRPGPKSAPIGYAQGASPTVSPKKPAQEFGRAKEEKFFRANDVGQSTSKQIRPTLSTKLSSNSSVKSNTRPVSTPKQEQTPIIHPTTPQSAIRNPVSPVQKRIRSSSNTSPIQSPTVRRKGSSANITPSSPKDHAKPVGTNSVAKTPTVIKSPASAKPYQPQPSFSPQIVIEPRLISPVDTSRSPDTISPRSTSLTSTNTATTSLTSNTELSDLSKAGQSFPPVKHLRTSSETPQQISPAFKAQLEAAANARRERKVLDLEISNSSLLAINKTLERELKKQNAELRRFRRLSRSGRLSLVPSNRSVSGPSVAGLDTLEEIDDEDDDQSDFDSDEENFEDDDEGLSEEASSLMGSTERARKRARDEKRLMLDLAKHQQMLIDSQKLSQSIQRCLNCTDELIKDGAKALAYHVGIGDVKLGGRVLSHDDRDNNHSQGPDGDENISQLPESRQGLLSPSISTISMEGTEYIWPDIVQISKKSAHLSALASDALALPTTESPSPASSPQLLADVE